MSIEGPRHTGASGWRSALRLYNSNGGGEDVPRICPNHCEYATVEEGFGRNCPHIIYKASNTDM